MNIYIYIYVYVIVEHLSHRMINEHRGALTLSAFGILPTPYINTTSSERRITRMYSCCFSLPIPLLSNTYRNEGGSIFP